MTRTVTVEEQVSQGLRRPTTQYITPYHWHDLTTTEREILGDVVNASGLIMAHRQQTHHAHSDDTALTNAFASLFYSIAYAVAFAIITAGILMIAWMLVGGPEEYWIMGWLVVWGICCLVALAYNRFQGLWFSSAGLGHAEIKSRERIAMHVVDRYVALLERKWRLE